MDEIKRGPGRPRKVTNELTVLKEGAISSGEWGGFLKVGDRFTPADDDARNTLIARGLASV